MEMYILVVLSSLNGSPGITTRFIEVNRIDNGFVIERSEYNYLGDAKIVAEMEEDEYGLSYFSFTSNEEEPRQFLCEDDESAEYIHGDVLEKEKEKEVGEFILRKVSGATLP